MRKGKSPEPHIKNTTRSSLHQWDKRSPPGKRTRYTLQVRGAHYCLLQRKESHKLASDLSSATLEVRAPRNMPIGWERKMSENSASSQDIISLLRRFVRKLVALWYFRNKNGSNIMFTFVTKILTIIIYSEWIKNHKDTGPTWRNI